MNDFWKSYDITHAEFGADYRCYPLYGGIHLTELALSLAFIAGMAWWYRRSSARNQLRVLKDCKLVRFRREGKTVYYALDDDHVRSILSMGMDHIEEE